MLLGPETKCMLGRNDQLCSYKTLANYEHRSQASVPALLSPYQKLYAPATTANWIGNAPNRRNGRREMRPMPSDAHASCFELLSAHRPYQAARHGCAMPPDRVKLVLIATLLRETAGA
jgi:hypothetical protein